MSAFRTGADLATALNLPAPEAARQLLGCELTRIIAGPNASETPTAIDTADTPPPQILRTRIVETEAYDQSDPASHSCRGRTPRTEVMFGPAGFLYVYFTYGMHYCCNVVVGPPGRGAAILIRAVEPLEGTAIMTANRRLNKAHASSHQPTAPNPNLANGPGKLCQALTIDRTLYGHDLSLPPLKLTLNPPLPDDQIITTTRIGIKQAIDTPWRFYIKDNPYVSRPAPPRPATLPTKRS